VLNQVRVRKVLIPGLRECLGPGQLRGIKRKKEVLVSFFSFPDLFTRLSLEKLKE